MGVAAFTNQLRNLFWKDKDNPSWSKPPWKNHFAGELAMALNYGRFSERSANSPPSNFILAPVG